MSFDFSALSPCLWRSPLFSEGRNQGVAGLPTEQWSSSRGRGPCVAVGPRGVLSLASSLCLPERPLVFIPPPSAASHPETSQATPERERASTESGEGDSVQPHSKTRLAPILAYPSLSRLGYQTEPSPDPYPCRYWFRDRTIYTLYL